jgi:hypothetical protein
MTHLTRDAKSSGGGRRRQTFSPVVWLAVGLVGLCNLALFWPSAWAPSRRPGLLTHTVYSYRQWQSTGIKLEAGDFYELRAQGEWAYSPIVGLHGPRGGRPAVMSYPLPSAPGGALIGRIGENGRPFMVGARTNGDADQAGFLFLRINDDLLGDNQGKLTVDISVVRATTPAP